MWEEEWGVQRASGYLCHMQGEQIPMGKAARKFWILMEVEPGVGEHII